MSDPADSKSVLPAENADIAERYKKDFWSQANLVFSEPHYRLRKALQIINGIAKGRECDLLDVGCGPAALMRLVPPNIRYHGIDIATHGQMPNVLEADLLKSPIRFGDKRFDIVLAQGFFEYVAELESQKFSEIADILNRNGKFVVTYWNYAHRNTQVYFAHSNVRPFSEFRDDLARHFKIDRFFPASHNWYHGSPSMKFNQALNMRLNVNIPFVSPKLAVEYFFICSPRRS
jgi:SAM-dependent methyltransferase